MLRVLCLSNVSVIGSASLFVGTGCTWKAVWKVSLVCGSLSARVDRMYQWTGVTTRTEMDQYCPDRVDRESAYCEVPEICAHRG